MAELILVQESVVSILQIVMTITAITLVVETLRAVHFVHREKESARIEQRMVSQHLPEEVAEQEVKEEEKTQEQEKKVARFALDEFIILKQLYRRIEQSPADLSFWQRTVGKLRAIRQGERMETRLTKRLKHLIQEAERVAKEEPSKKTRIEEALLEMSQANQYLLKIMGKGGEFEKESSKGLEGEYTSETKKTMLLHLLREAMQYDEKILAAVKRLNQIVES